MNQYRYTIFIPTYNRERTLARALFSAHAQTFRDFEILVIDDGSHDETRNLIEELRNEISAPLRYLYQENQGKHVAYNHAAKVARGEFLVLLDSDDVLVPDALEVFEETWNSIPESRREDFAGVEGLCQDTLGVLHGAPFPHDVFDTDYLTCRYQFGVSGEKRQSIRTTVLADYPYPVVPGERHIRPSLVWKRMAHKYLFRHINRVVQVVEFMDDGLTRNSRLRRLRTPGGLYLYYREDLALHSMYLSKTELRRSAAQYIRYALRYGVGIRQQLREVPHHMLWSLAFPRGLQDWILDSLKLIRFRKRLQRDISADE